MSTITEKIGLLLRQAESAGTVEEANTFTEKAQSLASTHAVDLAVARAKIAHREKREQPVQKSIKFGELGSKNLKKHLVSLYSGVARANDLKLDLYSDSSGVILFGFPSDMEVTELLFGSLAAQMVEAGNAYIAKGDYKNEYVYRSKRVKNPNYDPSYGWYGGGSPQYIEEWGTFPVDGRAARANFYQGFISEIARRLCESKRVAEAAVITEEENTGTALVLIQKIDEVKSFHQSESTAKGTYAGYRGSNCGNSYSAGSRSGANARLSGTRGITGPKTGIAS